MPDETPLHDPQGQEEQPETAAALQPENDHTEDTALSQELPEETKERTREQFEKLKKANAELKSQLDAVARAKTLPSVYESVLPGAGQGGVPSSTGQAPVFQGIAPQVVAKEQQKLMDEQGFIDVDALEQRLQAIAQAEERAKRAEEAARQAQDRIARFEQDATAKLLHQAYPELDPTSQQFNAQAYELVRNELVSQLIQTGEQDGLKAAQKWETFFRKPQPTQQQVQAQEALANIGTTQGAGRSALTTDLDQLRQQTRKGSVAALNERLKAIGA